MNIENEVSIQPINPINCNFTINHAPLQKKKRTESTMENVLNYGMEKWLMLHNLMLLSKTFEFLIMMTSPRRLNHINKKKKEEKKQEIMVKSP